MDGAVQGRASGDADEVEDEVSSGSEADSETRSEARGSRFKGNQAANTNRPAPAGTSKGQYPPPLAVCLHFMPGLYCTISATGC